MYDICLIYTTHISHFIYAREVVQEVSEMHIAKSLAYVTEGIGQNFVRLRDRRAGKMRGERFALWYLMLIDVSV